MSQRVLRAILAVIEALYPLEFEVSAARITGSEADEAAVHSAMVPGLPKTPSIQVEDLVFRVWV